MPPTMVTLSPTGASAAAPSLSNVQYGGPPQPSKTSIYIRKIPRKATYEHLETLFTQLVPPSLSPMVQIRIVKVNRSDQGARKYAFVDFEKDIIDQVLPAHTSVVWPFKEDPIFLKLEAAKPKSASGVQYGGERSRCSKTSIYIRSLPYQATYQNLDELFTELLPEANLSQIRIIKMDNGHKYAFCDFKEDVLDQILPQHELLTWPFGEDFELELEAASAPAKSREEGNEQQDDHDDDEPIRDSKTSIYVRNLPHEASYDHLETLFTKVVPQGGIAQIRIIKADQGRKFAFVDFEEDILDQILPLHTNLEWPFRDGPILKLEAAKPKTDDCDNNLDITMTSSVAGNHNLPNKTTTTTQHELYVGNLPSDTTEQDVSELFENLCPDDEVVRIRLKGRNRPYAFVDFAEDIQHVLGDNNANSKTVVCPWDTTASLELEATKGTTTVTTPNPRESKNRTVSSTNRGYNSDEDDHDTQSHTQSLFVGNLPEGTAEYHLLELVAQLYPDEKIARVRIKGRYSFVDFERDVFLKGALKTTVECTWEEGVQLDIEVAKPKNTSTSSDITSNRRGGGGRKARKEKSAITSIYVKNIPANTFEEDLYDFFRELCPKQKPSIVHLNFSAKANLYAFVDFDSDVQHVFGGHPCSKLLSPCPWSEDNVVLELEAAKNNTNTRSINTMKGGVEMDMNDTEDGSSDPSIYVRNLPRQTSSKHMSELFEQVFPDVTVRRIWISGARANKCAYVRLSQKEDIQKVLGSKETKGVACLWENGVVLEMEEAKARAN